jgi:ubiquinol-cytochrome c reductase cytochrome c1 subunit
VNAEIKMKKLVTLAISGAIAGFALTGVCSLALANEGQKDAKNISYSFEGPFGKFDRMQLQHGYKVYKEVCANCHSMNLVSYRNLAEAGIFDEAQVKALAATFTYKADPDENGEIKDRPGLPSDHFKPPYDNEQAARAANGGALPPDMSLLARSRPGWYGTFNQLWNGIGGPQYIYSVITGFEEPMTEEMKKEQPEGKYHNPYFANGPWIGMPPQLSEGLVKYDDKPDDYNTTIDEQARDVSAFLAWASEPHMEERKHLGFMVMIYLAVFAGLLYFVKKRVWADVH